MSSFRFCIHFVSLSSRITRSCYCSVCLQSFYEWRARHTKSQMEWNGTSCSRDDCLRLRHNSSHMRAATIRKMKFMTLDWSSSSSSWPLSQFTQTKMCIYNDAAVSRSPCEGTKISIFCCFLSRQVVESQQRRTIK